MLELAFVLALADAPRAAHATVRPTPRAAARIRPVRVEKIEPLDTSFGKPVTLTGSGFDQGSVVLVGEFAPVITERTATKLVFLVPYDPNHPESYRKSIHLVTPGTSVATIGELTGRRALDTSRAAVPAGPAPTPAPEGARTLVDEKVTLTSSSPKEYHLDMEGAGAVSFTLTCTGGEASVEARAEGKTEPVVTFTTNGGHMRRAAQQRQLHDPGTPDLGPIVVAFTTESKDPVGCSIKIGRTPLPKKP